MSHHTQVSMALFYAQKKQESEQTDMLEIINIPDYHKSSVKPRGFAEICDMVETQGRITGIWQFEQWNPKTGEVVKRLINKNVVTDQGAVNVFQCAITNAVPASVFNNILITNNSGSTTLTTALTANATGITTLAVAAIPAAIPSGTTLQLGYGTGNTQSVVTNGATTQGATSITVNSFTVNATGFTVGSNVVPVPQVSDNPNNAGLTSNATTPISQYSGNLAAGAFTYNATTGAGNRNVVVTFTFKNSVNGGTTPNGSYSDAWLINVASGATTNNYLAHEINSPMSVNNTNNLTCSITIKL